MIGLPSLPGSRRPRQLPVSLLLLSIREVKWTSTNAHNSYGLYWASLPETDRF